MTDELLTSSFMSMLSQDEQNLINIFKSDDCGNEDDKRVMLTMFWMISASCMKSSAH